MIIIQQNLYRLYILEIPGICFAKKIFLDKIFGKQETKYQTYFLGNGGKRVIVSCEAPQRKHYFTNLDM